MIELQRVGMTIGMHVLILLWHVYILQWLPHICLLSFSSQHQFDETRNTFGLLLQRCTKAQQLDESMELKTTCRGTLSCTNFIRGKQFVVFRACHCGSPIRCVSPHPIRYIRELCSDVLWFAWNGGEKGKKSNSEGRECSLRLYALSASFHAKF